MVARASLLVAVMLAGLLPTATAGPAEDTCHAIGDNPFAPQPLYCGHFAEADRVSRETVAAGCSLVQDVTNQTPAGEPVPCDDVLRLMDDPYGELERYCRWIADNPWIPLLLECEI